MCLMFFLVAYERMSDMGFVASRAVVLFHCPLPISLSNEEAEKINEVREEWIVQVMASRILSERGKSRLLHRIINC